MPVIIVTPSKATPQKVRDYILRDDKTSEQHTFSKNCGIEDFDKDFKMWEHACGKDFTADNRKYYHIKVSFSNSDDIQPERLKDWAEDFITQTNLNGTQLAGAIHLDTVSKGGCYHIHFVINNCRFDDNEHGKSGYAYQSTKQSLKEMQEISNHLCQEYGYNHSIIDFSEPAKVKETTAEREMNAKGKDTFKEQLRTDIDTCVSHSCDLVVFTNQMEQLGYELRFTKKDITYIHEEKGIHGCPGKRLGQAYSKEEIEERIEQNMEHSFTNTTNLDANSNDIRCLMIEPDKHPYEISIPNTLEDLQHSVGGDIQAIYPFQEEVALICNENGKLEGLDPNRMLFDEEGKPYDVVCGNFLVTGLTEDNFGSISEEHLHKFTNDFWEPEFFELKEDMYFHESFGGNGYEMEF